MPPREEPAIAPFWIEDLAEEAAGGRIRIGVAQSFLESLAEPGKRAAIVGLELAPAGTRLAPGDSLGLLHLPDRAVDLRIPFAFEVLARNAAALADPRLVAQSPYARGWLAEGERIQ